MQSAAAAGEVGEEGGMGHGAGEETREETGAAVRWRWRRGWACSMAAFPFPLRVHCLCESVCECVCVLCVGCDMFGVLSNCIICTFSSRHPLWNLQRDTHRFIAWQLSQSASSCTWICVLPRAGPRLPILNPGQHFVQPGACTRLSYDWHSRLNGYALLLLVPSVPLAVHPSTNFNNADPSPLSTPISPVVVVVVIHRPRRHLTTNSREK